MTKIINNTTKIYLSLLRIQQVIRFMESPDYENHDYVQKGLFSSFYLHLQDTIRRFCMKSSND